MYRVETDDTKVAEKKNAAAWVKIAMVKIL